MAYVYGHYKADTDELFYIGKGSGQRAWDTRSRNKHWNAVVKKHGYVVKILADNLTDEEAYAREMQLVESAGLMNLTNKTKGGVGLTSDVAKETMNRPEVKKKVSDAAKRRWQDPEFRKRRQEAMRKVRESEEYKKNHQDAMNRLAQDSDWLKANAERVRKSARNPERIEKIRESSRKRWEDPVYKERVVKSLKKGWGNQFVNKKLINGG